jgi:hypothetical protein
MIRTLNAQRCVQQWSSYAKQRCENAPFPLRSLPLETSFRFLFICKHLISNTLRKPQGTQHNATRRMARRLLAIAT